MEFLMEFFCPGFVAGMIVAYALIVLIVAVRV